MKKILFITTRNPFLQKFSGDRMRSSSIIKYLSKRNKVDLVYLDKKENEEISDKVFKGNKFFFAQNFLSSSLNMVKELINLNPLQVGFFYSKEAHDFVNNNHSRYDLIICHLIRSAKHMPTNYSGKALLEMTDIYSDNYKQTAQNSSLINPFFYLYSLESFLIKKYEEQCFSIFDKIILVDNKSINKAKHFIKNKITKINNGVDQQKKIFKFNKKNDKILFIGNINYLPNKRACIHFATKILPKINKKYPKVEFNIIGEISFTTKIFLSIFKNVKVLGPKKSILNEVKNSFCGIANLNIATGMQNKILTYMSFGLPTICSELSFDGQNFKKNKNILVYKNNKELINLIFNLKENKGLSNKISINGYKNLKKNFNWNVNLKKYLKII